MLDWIIEGLRWMVWGIISAGLQLMDICYDLVQKIASVDFFQSEQVWNWYYVFISFLGVLILVRTLSVYLKFSFDEEFREKVNGAHFINKFAQIAIIVALLPVILGFVSQVSVWGIHNINLFLGSTSTTKPSTFVITSFMNTDNGEYDENGKWVEGEKVTYTLDDVDINEEGKGEEDYKYFNDVEDLFILCFIGLAASVILILNSILIAKRSISIVMKTLIAPVPVSSLIVPGDETFTMWRKMIVSDYVLNYFQTMMIMVVMILSGSKIVQSGGVWVQIIMFIGGLLLLLSGIPELSKILGGDTSQAGILQQVASFRMATRGVGGAIKSGAGKIGRGVGHGAKMATYGFGRMAGGKGINEMQKASNSNSENGFMGGSRNSSEGNTDGFNLASIPHENRTANNRKSENATQRSNVMSENRLSRDGSAARSFADRAQSMGGVSGFGARFASNASRHIYQKSMNDVRNSRLYKSSRATLNLARGDNKNGEL